jgi:hypothetical protein
MEDPKGHALLESRIKSCPSAVEEFLKTPLSFSPDAQLKTASYVVTGAGSSIAHACYLTSLLNATGTAHAEYRPLTSFLSASRLDDRERVLVVISQGLSPNAEVALARRSHFKRTILFTSLTKEGARSSTNDHKVKLLETLDRDGAALVRFPLENEYTILIRVLGPLLGYLACFRFSLALFPALCSSSFLGELPKSLLAAEDKAKQLLKSDGLSTFKNGVDIFAPFPINSFAQNLTYKFLEGPFWPTPTVWDLLHLAHGPLQQLKTSKRLALCLLGPESELKELDLRMHEALKIAGARVVDLRSSLPPYLRIFEYEMILNYIMLEAIKAENIDQRNWPGKGEDKRLYSFGG